MMLPRLQGNGDYGRLFPDLAPWEPRGSTEDAKIESLWDLAEGMYRGPSEENPDVPAAYTYFGQLINHDLSHETGTSLLRPVGSAALRNLRLPRFDLDSVYGDGRAVHPHIYAIGQPGKLLVGVNDGGEYDLPRNRDTSGGEYAENPVERERTALIGDARNDENILIAQMHLAVIRFHNRYINKKMRGADFEDARRLTRWHYQWVATHDFLKRLCGSALVDTLLGVRPAARLPPFERRPFIPLEFAMAAFRAGHSMVRPSYHLNDALRATRGGVPHDIVDRYKPQNSLHGGRELPPDWTVQWDLFVEHDGSDPQKSMRIDPALAPPLRDLRVPSPDARFRSLAFLTLMRGWRMGLPSGQDVARAMEEEPLPGHDPLWFYVLREAAEKADGRRLGPVAARIVAEVFTGLLAVDPDSYLNRDPPWRPDAVVEGGSYGLGEFLLDAGVPMTKQQWENERRI